MYRGAYNSAAGLRARIPTLNLRSVSRAFATLQSGLRPRRWLLALAVAAASLATTRADAGSLSPAEGERLAHGETITREQTIETDDHRYVGGVTYTVLDATSAELAAMLDDVDSWRHVLPKTKRARVVGAVGTDQLLELTQGNAVVEAQYTVRLRRGANEARFWLDPSRPHGIDDAWGFFRYQPITRPDGTQGVLLTYGVLVDVGPGIVRELFEERIRTALLSVPQLVRRQVAVVRRQRPRASMLPL